MKTMSRRKLITTGLAAAAGASGLAAAAKLAARYGLVPPDHGGLYGVGETLTYASQRLITRHTMAREFGTQSDLENAVLPTADCLAMSVTSSSRPPGSPAGSSRSMAWFALRLVLDRRPSQLSGADANHAPRLRRGLVLHRRVDRGAARARSECRRRSAECALRRVLLDPEGLVGKC